MTSTQNQDLQNSNGFWSFEVILEYIGPRNFRKENLPTVKLHITNDELLLKEPEKKKIINLYEDFNGEIFLLTYSLSEICSEKLRTILQQRCYSKDVYDTWKILREYGTILNISETIEIYNLKCLYRNLIPGIPNNIDERIFRLKEQWDNGLRKQLHNVPDFELVAREIIGLLNSIFNEKYHNIKGGTNMLQSNYLIKYKKGDVEIEVQGDKEFVENKFKELVQQKVENANKKETNLILAPKINEIQTDQDKKLSISEYLNSKKAKTHGDKILVFGYYLEKNNNQTSFNRDDIEECYIKSRTPKSTNFGVYLGQLIAESKLMEVDDKKDNKKAWQLTGTGEKYVEEDLNNG